MLRESVHQPGLPWPWPAFLSWPVLSWVNIYSGLVLALDKHYHLKFLFVHCLQAHIPTWPLQCAARLVTGSATNQPPTFWISRVKSFSSSSQWLICFRQESEKQVNLFDDNVSMAVNVTHSIYSIIVRYLFRQQLQSITKIWTDFLRLLWGSGGSS